MLVTCMYPPPHMTRDMHVSSSSYDEEDTCMSCLMRGACNARLSSGQGVGFTFRGLGTGYRVSGSGLGFRVRV